MPIRGCSCLNCTNIFAVHFWAHPINPGGRFFAWNLWAQKKGLRRVPTFVNLKSNTMKNIAKLLILRHIAKFYRAFLALLLPKRTIF